MIEYFPSKSGSETVTFQGLLLHSAYNPRKEAIRFIASNAISKNKVFIVIGAGLGYLPEELKRQFPESIVIAFSFHDELCKKSRNRFTGPVWSPGLKSSPGDFLLKYLQDDNIENTTVLEWPPEIRAFPKTAATVSSQIIQTIRERQGSVLTSAFFGRRWIRNSLLNFLFTNSFIIPTEISKPILIAASGPTLSIALPYLSEFRSSVSIWALPSSLDALEFYSIQTRLYRSDRSWLLLFVSSLSTQE